MGGREVAVVSGGDSLGGWAGGRVKWMDGRESEWQCEWWGKWMR